MNYEKFVGKNTRNFSTKIERIMSFNLVFGESSLSVDRWNFNIHLFFIDKK